jgi:hypothetical protein
MSRDEAPVDPVERARCAIEFFGPRVLGQLG